jgi:acetyl-CoA acetyltransferase
VSDVDLFELNEAFASQSLAVVRELGVDQVSLFYNSFMLTAARQNKVVFSFVSKSEAYSRGPYYLS